jgi:pimeloyl-ACP methyl ester carboxylesterase
VHLLRVDANLALDRVEVVLKTIATEVLEIGFEDGGPEDGRSVFLVHGWPDAPCGWSEVARRLQQAGWQTIVPYLRGSGATRFRYEETPRVGAGVALAQDVIDLADGLGIGRFAVVGHDWGARVGYTLAALFPERVASVAALALAYQPRGLFKVPSFEQSRRFWYQWFLCADGGVEKVQEDPIGFARIQWETWSPAGWFTEAEFAETVDSFRNPDWVAITRNAYRSRWREGEASDARYDDLQRRLGEVETLSTPTLMIQGESDFCDPPNESEGQDRYFSEGYRRVVLEGVGHFPHREAADVVTKLILEHLEKTK